MGGRTSAASRNKYNAKAYDRVNLVVPKGQKALITTYAQEKGLSLNGYINSLIRADMGDRLPAGRVEESTSEDPSEE